MVAGALLREGVMKHRLNPIDACWLMLDSARAPLHHGALLIFRKPAGAGADYVAGLSARVQLAAEEIEPPWNFRLSRGVLGKLGASWVEENELDLEYHVRHSALPAPGGERELGTLVARLHSSRLDLSRPPWECHLIEGLHDDTFAIYFKLHQALLDAADFMWLLTAALTSAPDSEPPMAWWNVPLDTSSREIAGARVGSALRGLLRGRRGLRSLRALAGTYARQLRSALLPGAELQAPYTAPRSALNTPIGPQRRFATQQFALPRLHSAAAELHATVDELVLYLCATALRRFFREYNALPEAPLLAAVPGEWDREGSFDTGVGGALSFVALGTQHANPLKRLKEIQASLLAYQVHLQSLPEELVPAYTLGLVAPFMLGQLAGAGAVVPAMFNLIVATLRGPERPMYLEQAELAAIYPIFPLTQDCALSISCMTYADTVNLGFAGAAEVLPSLQRMAVYAGQALNDLEELLAAGAIHD
jgi:diacylglycerol O-acyltransferase / wax synthase